MFYFCGRNEGIEFVEKRKKEERKKERKEKGGKEERKIERLLTSGNLNFMR